MNHQCCLPSLNTVYKSTNAHFEHASTSPIVDLVPMQTFENMVKRWSCCGICRLVGVWPRSLLTLCCGRLTSHSSHGDRPGASDQMLAASTGSGLRIRTAIFVFGTDSLLQHTALCSLILSVSSAVGRVVWAHGCKDVYTDCAHMWHQVVIVFLFKYFLKNSCRISARVAISVINSMIVFFR